MTVNGFVNAELKEGSNTFDFEVTARDTVSVNHYILTVIKDETVNDDDNDDDNNGDGYCRKPVSGICLTYNKNKDVPVLGILLSFIHRIVHIFHRKF